MKEAATPRIPESTERTPVGSIQMADLRSASQDFYVEPVAVKVPIGHTVQGNNEWSEPTPRLRLVLGRTAERNERAGVRANAGMGTGWADGHTDLTPAEARALISALQRGLREMRGVAR